MNKTMLIEDGYDFEGKLPAEGLRPGTVIRYRPATNREVEAYQDKLGPGASTAAMVDHLKEHLRAWTVAGRDGKVVPITEETIEKLPRPFMVRMVNFVNNYDPSAREIDEKN